VPAPAKRLFPQGAGLFDGKPFCDILAAPPPLAAVAGEIWMQSLFWPMGLILLTAVSGFDTQSPTVEPSGRPVILAGNATEPGCVAQLNDSSCRPDKFPQHNPDPAIQAPQAPRDRSPDYFPKKHELALKSVDCQFGTGSCYCTNRMAMGKAKALGARLIKIHGYADRVIIKGVKYGRSVELVISRERTCPVIAAR
jgi:hypothetical protein